MSAESNVFEMSYYLIALCVEQFQMTRSLSFFFSSSSSSSVPLYFTDDVVRVTRSDHGELIRERCARQVLAVVSSVKAVDFELPTRVEKNLAGNNPISDSSILSLRIF